MEKVLVAIAIGIVVSACSGGADSPGERDTPQASSPPISPTPSPVETPEEESDVPTAAERAAPACDRLLDVAKDMSAEVLTTGEMREGVQEIRSLALDTPVEHEMTELLATMTKAQTAFETRDADLVEEAANELPKVLDRAADRCIEVGAMDVLAEEMAS